ncbi:DUF397 domain-containing protein [Streptomyces solisilvae]
MVRLGARDSKAPGGPVLSFANGAWAALGVEVRVAAGVIQVWAAMISLDTWHC